MSTIRFALIPEWVLYQASPVAVKVYGVLRRLSDHENDTSHARVGTIAERAGLSERQTQRVLRELKEMGAIDARPRFDDRGQKSNEWILWAVPFGGREDPLPATVQMSLPTVTATSPTPPDISVTPSTERSQEPTERLIASPTGSRNGASSGDEHDLVYHALLFACGMESALTKQEARRTALAANELVPLMPTWDDIQARAAAWPSIFGDATMTPMAIARNWARLAGVPRASGRARDVQYLRVLHELETT